MREVRRAVGKSVIRRQVLPRNCLVLLLRQRETAEEVGVIALVNANQLKMNAITEIVDVREHAPSSPECLPERPPIVTHRGICPHRFHQYPFQIASAIGASGQACVDGLLHTLL